MTNTLLTLLLSLQLTLPAQPAAPQSLAYHPRADVQPQKIWWGLIDPELALWFAHLPEESDGPLLWDWSWRGFLAALFPQSLVKEDSYAPSV